VSGKLKSAFTEIKKKHKLKKIGVKDARKLFQLQKMLVKKTVIVGHAPWWRVA